MGGIEFKDRLAGGWKFFRDQVRILGDWGTFDDEIRKFSLDGGGWAVDISIDTVSVTVTVTAWHAAHDFRPPFTS